jgi:hypothetical protein
VSSKRKTDKGWLDLEKLIRQHKARNTVARVGYVGAGAKQDHGSITNAELGLIMEYGTADGHIPARPHIRPAITGNLDEYRQMYKKLLPRVLEGEMEPERMMGIVGLKASSDIKRGITTGEGIPPPNAPSTIAAKGSDRPLVDTSQLVNSITFEVISGGVKGEE